ncbi:MAG: MBL fold metallo-hydrolase [Bacteroidota bacterium]
MKIQFLQANNGDCIWISFTDEYNQPVNILIDGGTKATYLELDRGRNEVIKGELYHVVESIRTKNQKIDLLILTHIDNDHIGGILRWFEEDPQFADLIDNVWFNSAKLISEYFKTENINQDFLSSKRAFIKSQKIGVAEGIKFEELIDRNDIWQRQIIQTGDQLEVGRARFTILSPNLYNLKRLLDKWERHEKKMTISRSRNDYEFTIEEFLNSEDKFSEDASRHNGSSIAFIMTWKGKNWLFTADSLPSTIALSLEKMGYTEQNPIEVEFFMVSHHGSKSNTSTKLLTLVKCDNYVLSTNGERHGHPHKQCLARIVKHNPNARFYFNYADLYKKIFRKEIASGDFNTDMILSTEFFES